MSADTLPPPPPPVCLLRAYVSRGRKGGTVIAENVLDLDTHRRLILDPDGYRHHVSPCRACGCAVLHAHCFRSRILRPASRKEPAVEETIRLYICSSERCGAVFTVLPAVIARHLWRLWETVEQVSSAKSEAPPTTKRRWLSRLASSAIQLVQALLALGSALLGDLPSLLPRVCTRRDLLDAVRSTRTVPPAHAFAGLAGWIHRLQPGIRLM